MSNPTTPQSSDAPATSFELAEEKKHVRERAYQLWEFEGRPEGRLDEYWDRARELIQAETRSAYPPAASRSKRT
jgi:hypothetical protein